MGERSTAEELMAEGAMRVPEAVRFSGLGKTTLYNAMERGELAYVRKGAARLIPRRALMRWLADGLVARNDAPPEGDADGTHETR